MLSRIEGIITVDKIVSVNNYLVRGVHGKPVLTKEARDAKEEYALKLAGYTQKVPDDWKYISLTLGFYFHKYFDSRDLSNCVKIFEDVLYKHFGIDDSVNTDITLFKRDSDDNKERIYFKIEQGLIRGA